MDRFAVVILILVNLSAAASLRAEEAGAPVAAADQVGQWSISPSKVNGEAIPTGYPVVLDPERAEYPSVLPRFLGRGRGVFGGYEFGWLQPRFADNVSVVVQTPTGNDALAFDHQYRMASRVWVGIENARCNGIRASFWQFDSAAPTQVNFATAGSSPLTLTIFGAGGNLSRTATANVGDAMTSDHELEMRTIDLEATHRMRFSCTEALTSLGLRYAKTHQRVHAVATDGTGSLTELVCQDLYFDGFGPTVDAQLTRPLFGNHSILCGLSCFANTRASLLFGTQRQEIVLVTAGGANLAEDVHEQYDFLPIGELVGGLQWATRPFGHGLWTIRTGYRAECWFGAGGPVGTDSNLALQGMVLSIAANY